MDKWLKDVLPDKDPYHNRGRDQMRKRGGGSGIQVPVLAHGLICPNSDTSSSHTKALLDIIIRAKNGGQVIYGKKIVKNIVIYIQLLHLLPLFFFFLLLFGFKMKSCVCSI